MNNTQVFDDATQKIIDKIVGIFVENVKGKKPDLSVSNQKHDGKAGHWLETQMGIAHNGNNEPDLLGFEMKNNTSAKTTFGDWSANYYIFNKASDYDLTRHDFMCAFGKYNVDKDRYSWSGQPFPKFGVYNNWGQIMTITPIGDIEIAYSYSKDLRSNKAELVPEALQIDGLVLARWDGDSIKVKVENKFNKLGWFKCVQDKNGVYSKIVFGKPIRYVDWLERVKEGIVYLDSGMYSDLNKPNIRPYQGWRANNRFWDSLIVAVY